jgi:hypothetical protein
MKRILISALLLAMAATACNKSDETPEQSTKEILVNKRWQVIKEIKRDSLGHNSQDAWPLEPDYLKDDYTIWYSNMQYVVMDNNITHPGSTTVPQVDSGSWSLKNSIISGSSVLTGMPNPPSTITSISSGRMVIEVPAALKSTNIYTMVSF